MVSVQVSAAPGSGTWRFHSPRPKARFTAARPGGGAGRRLYTERQLFYGLVRMRTPAALRLPGARAARIKAP